MTRKCHVRFGGGPGEKEPCYLACGLPYYHEERPHQGKGNVVRFPVPSQSNPDDGPIQCRERLGGLLKYYHREAA